MTRRSGAYSGATPCPERVFAHISSYGGRGRPVANRKVTYSITKDGHGRLRITYHSEDGEELSESFDLSKPVGESGFEPKTLISVPAAS